LIIFFFSSIVFIFEKDHSVAIEMPYEKNISENIKSVLLQISISEELSYDSFVINSNELNARILFFSKLKKIAIIEIPSNKNKEEVLVKTKRKFINSSISIIDRFPSELLYTERSVYDIKKPHMTE
jgi:hypothetical protein